MLIEPFVECAALLEKRAQAVRKGLRLGMVA